jgi:putative endonuclease
MRAFYVYILASRSGILYVGMTNDLRRRVQEHKRKLVPGFTAKYNVNLLVYFEGFPTAMQAIAAEKQLKGWRREKKVALIERTNPTWSDLAADLGQEAMETGRNADPIRQGDIDGDSPLITEESGLPSVAARRPDPSLRSG